MSDLSWVPDFIKIGANLSFGTEFARIHNFRSGLSIETNVFLISIFAQSAKFYKNERHCRVQLNGL